MTLVTETEESEKVEQYKYRVVKLKEIFQKIKSKVKKVDYKRILKTLDFQISLRKFSVVNALKIYVLQKIKNKLFVIISFLYFLFLFTLAYSFEIYIGSSLDIDNAITFFTAAGSMVGGILAIIFSLNILLMDKAEKIPTGFYDIAASDKSQNFIYFLISGCSLFLFVSSLIYGRIHIGYSKYALEIALIVLGLVFYLVFLLYRRVLKKLNPIHVMNEVYGLAIKELKRIKRKAEYIAKILKKNPDLDGSISEETVIAKSYEFLQPDLRKINASLNYLFDYHDRLITNRERSSAEEVLDIIQSILSEYIKTRRNTSTIIPTYFLITSISDSNAFLTPVLERLQAIAEEYMKENNTTGITKIIRLFRDMYKISSEINYVTGRRTDNPILSLFRGYLDQIVESSVKLNSLEGLFQSAIVYKDLGIISIQKSLCYEMTPVFNTLEKISFAGMTLNHEVVMTEAINSLNALLHELIQTSHHNLEIKLRPLVEKIQNIVYLSYMSHRSGTLRENYFSLTSLSTPFEVFRDSLLILARKVEETEEESREYKRSFLIATEELRRLLRNLSDSIKNADHILIGTFGKVIEDIGVVLLELSVNPKWENEKRELVNQASWYIHQPEWFTSDVPKIKSNQSFDSLVEAVSKIGIKAVQVGNLEIATVSVEIIQKFALEMLEKEEGTSYGYTEPRIMERACYVGIIALKSNLQQVVDRVKVLIEEFETAYVAKWFPDGREVSSPKKNQLLVELFELIDASRQFDRLDRILDNSREVVLELVNTQDIKAFITRIWGITVND